VIELSTLFPAELPLSGIWTYGMPEAKSNWAPLVDLHYAGINIVNFIFGVPITVLLVYFAWRYHKPKGAKAESDVSHNTPLEITWTIIPLILVIIMFTVGFRGYAEMRTPPADSYRIAVRAQQWSWTFTYPDGTVVDVGEKLANVEKDGKLVREVTDPKAGLHLPPGVPIMLEMTSADVLHAFFVAEFRAKQDIVPGKISKVWFEPAVPAGTEPEMYWLQCAEYCGTGHSEMYAPVYVHPTWESFEAWKVKANLFDEKLSFEDRGKILSKRKGCATCHSVKADAPGMWVGPTWDGLWGKSADEHPVHVGAENGPIEKIAMQGEAGEAYLLESMRNPKAKISAGFTNAMPIKKLTDEEILYLTAYIKSLGKKESN
jgi:cytochrome c oxidase subunit 2